jgi:hypothetical protein
MKNSHESRIRRIKRALVRRGLGLRLSPTKNRRAPEWGKFQVVELETNDVVRGKGYVLTLDEVEAFACN